MKPYQVLLFVGGTFSLLFCISLLMPEDGIGLNSEYRLKFVNAGDLFTPDTSQYADISQIISSSSAISEEPEFEDQPGKIIENIVDTILPADPDSLLRLTQAIEYPEGQKELLYSLFRKLKTASGGKEMIRILHYGDSQIEADRMTSLLRNKMQKTFGGGGSGMVAPVPLYGNYLSLRQSQSPGWNRYTGFANQDSSLGHQRYGALFTFARYSVSDSLDEGTAWLSFEQAKAGYALARNYNRVSLFMKGNCPGAKVKVLAEDTLISELIFEDTSRLEVLGARLEQVPARLSIEFNGSCSPDVYGLSFDRIPGVAVDNIPLRGSSGLVFSQVDHEFLGSMYSEMNIGLILLQFGGNVVPHFTDSYEYYKRLLKREVEILKRICPKTPVIFIGPSDMSLKENGRYVTYPNLEKVRNAVRDAALESGCGFWDMYEAMGGINSMPSWVSADPPLAISDYVHFNPKGARIIAEMFFNSFMAEYQKWNALKAGINEHQSVPHD